MDKNNRDKTQLVLVRTTFENQQVALALARKMIEEHRAACAQVSSPVQSVYYWEGAVQIAEEVVLTAKVTGERAPELQKWIERHHDYDTPEILCVSVESNDAYGNWVAKTCG